MGGSPGASEDLEGGISHSALRRTKSMRGDTRLVVCYELWNKKGPGAANHAAGQPPAMPPSQGGAAGGRGSLRRLIKLPESMLPMP